MAVSMSAAILVRLACGCSVETLGSADLEPPQCQAHHERRVTDTQAPKPRIVAVNCNKSRPMGPLVNHV